ncbi:TVP38/TMEM64 family protein [Bythopirellula polymerisocia]|uniref:TVP38/TMEM64 family membrane protein n=1 Tax=Bythopirellula polymerisocia TaxID=2528003 RepID=A0A5C6CHC6_9BACT|nr:TVP38/TMEM64 family protein [Bythopirellula polymerisocia]TWU22671.1 TVP38/TMEM64 family inner membrane protein YdjZ [Bythopirellula polymerisocia]
MPVKSQQSSVIKLVLLIVLASVMGIGYFLLRDVLTLEALAEQEARLREFQKRNPSLAYLVVFVAYAAITGISLPGATVLTLVVGWFFGLIRGVLLVSFASTTGATIAFLLSRYLFREVVQNHFGERLAKFNEMLERDGPYYLFTLRLIPAVPFFVINVVMGLTPVKTLTFWWVSQLGMFAGTCVYVYAGSSVPSLQILAEEGIGAVFSGTQLARLGTAFVLLGIFPLAVRWIMRYFGKETPAEPVETK